MEQLEYIIIQVIFNAALEASDQVNHRYIDGWTDEAFYEACHELNDQIYERYLSTVC